MHQSLLIKWRTMPSTSRIFMRAVMLLRLFRCWSQPMPILNLTSADDLVASPVGTNKADLGKLINVICASRTFPSLDIDEWMATGYKPTPTIVQAAEILYRTHSVIDISRSDAGAKNLQETSASVSSVIDRARQNRAKAICFVTGVPGSGKTLAGLN